MKHKSKEGLISDQRGIASMVIVILIMTFLSLIVLAMTRDSNREQRQSLDRQLNSQAFYAAESGINDAEKYLSTTPAAADEKTNCNNVTGASDGNQFGAQSSVIGSDSSIRYSCVLYDKKPDHLIFQSSTTKSDLSEIKDADGGVIKSLEITWYQSSVGNTNFSSCPSFGSPNLPQSLDNNTCQAGGVRLELTDIAGAAIASRANLIRNNFLAYLLPSNNSAPPPASPQFSEASGSPDRQGKLWNGYCSAANKCKVTIDNIFKTRLMLHLRSIYKDSTIDIRGTTVAGTSIQFEDGQIEIDSTGRANDVTKRLQVRRPNSEFSRRESNPEFALQTTDDICKLLNLLPPPNPNPNLNLCATP